MKERKIVFLLTLAGLVFRFLHFWIFSNDLVVGGDQMQNIVLARRFAAGDFYGSLDTYWTPIYPFLIGIVSYFIDSLILPSVIISILAGGLAVTVTFFLVKQSYGQREAVIASIIAIFYPHLINSVFALGSENIYLLLIICALIFGWRGLKTDSLYNLFLTGISFGLAYLTRPEAFAYPIYFACLVGGKKICLKNLPRRNSLTQIGVLLLGFTIFAAPYIFYLRTATGTWTISDKTKINTVAGELSEENLPESDAESNYVASDFQNGKILINAIAYNLTAIHKCFPNFLPPLLLIFVAVGLFREKWNREKFQRESYLIAFCLITILGYAVTVVQIRYFYFLLPIFFGWIAHGIVESEKWLQESLHNCQPLNFPGFFNGASFTAATLLFIYLYVFPLNFYMLPCDKWHRSVAYEERDAGLWLKQHGKPSPLIFSASRRPVFYAEGKQLTPNTTEIKEILSEIKNSQADYVIASDRSLQRNPYLKDFAQILQNSQDFELVYENKEQPEYEIRIFKLR